MINYYSTTPRSEHKVLICGKCKKVQYMIKIPYGKKEEEFSWWCPNCEDKISQTACMTKITDKK